MINGNHEERDRVERNEKKGGKSRILTLSISIRQIVPMLLPTARIFPFGLKHRAEISIDSSQNKSATPKDAISCSVVVLFIKIKKYKD